MSCRSEIEKRGIDEVLHFTRGDNLIGILVQGSLVSRAALEQKDIKYESLEYVSDPVWPDRSRDKDWWQYINLSIQSINWMLLCRARNNHPEQDWFVLSFNPELLDHPKVLFTTTNNAYVPHVKRGEGLNGFNLPYSASYRDRLGNLHSRHKDLPLCYPTSQQAEVLYPNELSLDFLKKIYVEDEKGFLHAKQALLSLEYIPGCKNIKVDLEINPEKFKAHPLQRAY